MTLYNYLKQFKNICWYPSAYRDTLSMVALSYKSLREYGFNKEEVPDCFLFTDYDGHSENGEFFLDPNEDEIVFSYENSDHLATAFSIKELNRLDIGFDQDMVAFEADRNYGRVFIADVLIEHPKMGKILTKLAYVIAENTKFAIDFLLKKNIKVTYVIHSRYGHGFGGGISCGSFICNILKDLGTRYFASDMDEHYKEDIADKYLTEEQLKYVPVLKEIDNFQCRFDWSGYGPTIFYEVVGYSLPELGFFKSPKFNIK